MRRATTPRLLAAAALLVAGVAALAILPTDGRHKVTALFDEASYISPGTKVVVAGQKVGRVESADATRSGKARVVLSIEDERTWPLPQGTKARIRALSTIAAAGRYIELELPARGNPPIADGGAIAAQNAIQPVEFDTVFRTFDAATRANLRRTLRTAGPAIGGAGDELRRALEHSPAAVGQARAVIEDLGADPRALQTLVRSTDRVLESVESSDPGLDRLLAAAATTFSTVGSRATDLARALDEMPATLTSARRSLSHADRTLRAAREVTSRLDPGTRELRRLAGPLERVLGTVVAVGPDAQRTLSTLRTAAPDLNPLLVRARELMPRIASVGRQAAEQVACIRPYAPEVGGLAATWSGFQIQGDKTDKYARLYTPAFPYDPLPLTPGQASKRFPGMRYAFPRPPGEVAGQPWFIPACGVGPETVDPTKDPEAR
jgi:phospholipid/cholesterol/gamma-HCH transport system substrate-binding protein